MSDTRKLVVGVTVNLGNNENLHLEVSDTVQSEDDASSLRRYLASVLSGFGANDPAVRSQVSGYAHRVLSDADSPAVPDFSGFGMFEETVPVTEFREDSSGSSDASFESPEPAAEPQLPPLPPAPFVEEKIEEFVCSKCGAPVTKSQRDISMLFNHKILCQSCMNK